MISDFYADVFSALEISPVFIRRNLIDSKCLVKNILGQKDKYFNNNVANVLEFNSLDFGDLHKSFWLHAIKNEKLPNNKSYLEKIVRASDLNSTLIQIKNDLLSIDFHLLLVFKNFENIYQDFTEKHIGDFFDCLKFLYTDDKESSFHVLIDSSLPISYLRNIEKKRTINEKKSSFYQLLVKFNYP